MTEEDALVPGSSTDAPATTPTTTGASGGKVGGKGRNPPEFKDPPVEDEADVYMHGLLKNLKGDFFAQKAG